MQIRPRNREQDDRYIYRMVYEELLPYANAARPDTRISRAEISRRLQQGTVWVIAPGRKGKPAGFISFFRRDRDLHIDMLAVDRHFQSRGLGGKLMEAAEQYGLERGCQTVKLFVDGPNPLAQQFYFRRGYTVSEYYPSYRCFLLNKHL